MYHIRIGLQCTEACEEAMAFSSRSHVGKERMNDNARLNHRQQDACSTRTERRARREPWRTSTSYTTGRRVVAVAGRPHT